MKRIISLLLVAVLLALAFSACNRVPGDPTESSTEKPTEAQKPTDTEASTETQNPTETVPPQNDGADDEDDKNGGNNDTVDIPFVPVVRFAVASDMHVTTADGTQAKRTAAMIKQMNAYAKTGAGGYGKLDAFLIAGDLTDNGTPEQFKIVNDIFKANIEDETELILAMGNHDNAKIDNGGGVEFFDAEFGVNSSMRDEVIGGYHVISIYGDANNTASDYTQSMCDKLEERIKNALKDTGSDKPIFILQHVGELNTVVGTDSYTQQYDYAATDALYEMKSNYPNLVVFSGHIHFPNNDECSIWQGDFTEINTGTLAYSIQSMKNGQKIPIANKYDLAQCYVVEVDSIGRVKVKCWDVLQEKFVGEEWMIDSYDPTEFKYTIDRFSDGDIFFADDATVKIEQQLTSSTVLSFPPVSAESLTGRVYEVKLYEKGGALKETQYIGDDYFKDIFDRRINVSFSDLEQKKEYTVEIYALNSLYVTELNTGGTLRSQPLTLNFSLKQKVESGVDLIDLEISKNENKVSNAVSIGLDAKAEGSLNIVHDDSIDRDVVVFDGTGNGLVNFGNYTFVGNELTDSFTIESYFKVDDDKDGYIIGATQHGGFSFQVKGTDIVISLEIDPALENAEYDSTLSFKYVVGQYYHVILLFDGSRTSLYVNGILKGSIAMEDFGLPWYEAARSIWLGADVSSNGGHDDDKFGRFSIVDFKLYSYALDESELKDAINKAPVPPTVTPPAVTLEKVVDIEVNATANTVANSISGIDTYVDGTLKTEHDSDINKDVVVLDGSGNGLVRFGSYSDIVNDLEDSMTVEAYLKIDQLPESGQSVIVIGAMQSGGFGLRAYGEENGSNSKKMLFYFYTGSEYVNISFDYEEDTYYHIAAVYSGSYYKLYVNGERVENKAMTSLKMPPYEKNADLRYVWLGVDTARNGANEAKEYAKCSIAEFKIYNYALTAADITSAYNGMVS